ncbi:HAD family hydrolase [Clostridium sp.]|uniref:HAD family hydrolase n=1 Tax=Clostridium sp. TaxID=1506 RepID=UPI00261229CA|nr:HAD family hydrolase [Clostridium sp.]
MIFLTEWVFMDMGSTFINEEECYNYRIIETLQQKNAPSKDEFLKKMSFYAKQNKDPYKCALKEFGLNKVHWKSEYEKLYEGTYAVLEKLHGKYKLGIIANQELGTEQRLVNFGIRHFFDVIAASAEENVAKPNQRLFRIALEKANCSPADGCMVGDRLDNDIIPAIELGMKAIWVKQGWGGMGSVDILEKEPDIIISKFANIIDYM